jgi:8-oxo-dGTP diphosphatase
MCTPSLAIDAVIEPADRPQGSILLVKRRDPPNDVYAIPGGFVDVGESVESAVIREVKEEVNLDLEMRNLHQFRIYSDPERDKRRHTVSAVFRCSIESMQIAKSGSDAKEIVVVHLRDLDKYQLGFDHRKILTDYRKKYHPNL